MGKIPFHLDCAPIFSEYLIRIIANKFGKSKRCLICDLDNTLWGGVIGDDGLDGILLGNGDPISEAHLELQKNILEIKNRGIVLAICSKMMRIMLFYRLKNIQKCYLKMTLQLFVQIER